jgi:hypothetical protein
MLGTLLTGFLAGISTYKAILEIADLATVRKSDLANLQERSQKLDTLNKDRPSDPVPHKRVMTISTVDPGVPVQTVGAFRLVVQINEVIYSLPINSVWAERSTTWGPFTVSLPPPNDGRYTIRFSAFYRYQDGHSQREMPQPVDLVKDADLPILKEYATAQLKVSYRIE